MNINLIAFDQIYLSAQIVTHPLARLAARLPLSLVVAGIGLLPPRFAAATRPDALSGVFNHGF